jgi:hypothetical protein
MSKRLLFKKSKLFPVKIMLKLFKNNLNDVLCMLMSFFVLCLTAMCIPWMVSWLPAMYKEYVIYCLNYVFY